MKQETVHGNLTDVVLIGVYRRCIEIGTEADTEKADAERELVRRGLDLALAGDPQVSVFDERLVSAQAREHALGL